MIPIIPFFRVTYFLSAECLMELGQDTRDKVLSGTMRRLLTLVDYMAKLSSYPIMEIHFRKIGPLILKSWNLLNIFFFINLIVALVMQISL